MSLPIHEKQCKGITLALELQMNNGIIHGLGIIIISLPACPDVDPAYILVDSDPGVGINLKTSYLYLFTGFTLSGSVNSWNDAEVQVYIRPHNGSALKIIEDKSALVRMSLSFWDSTYQFVLGPVLVHVSDNNSNLLHMRSRGDWQDYDYIHWDQ